MKIIFLIDNQTNITLKIPLTLYISNSCPLLSAALFLPAFPQKTSVTAVYRKVRRRFRLFFATFVTENDTELIQLLPDILDPLYASEKSHRALIITVFLETD